MLLKRLNLINFRNYSSLEICPGRGVNVLFGDNAQGKTNVLESIYLLAKRTSHRAERDAEMVKWGERSFSVSGRFSHEHFEFEINIAFSEDKGKTVRVNGLPRRSTDGLVPDVQVVIFVPDDLQMVKGPASMRRSFLDHEISQVNSTYAFDLSRYNKAVFQRNSLLRNGASPKDPVVSVFTDQVVEYGTSIYRKRLSALRRIAPVAQHIHSKLTQGEKLEVIYKPSVPITGGETDQTIRELFYRRLEEKAGLEREKAMTLVGPHRDDILFMIGGRDARQFGSQGQQRSIVVSLKVSELHFVREETGRFPMLLLDDILSELDASRRHGLLSAVTQDVQVFLTCTDYSPFESELPRETRYYRVSRGSVEEQAGG